LGFSLALLLRAVPLLPSGVLFAAVYAFTEEIYFCASFLATLPVVIGRGHAMLISLVFIGLAHFLYGSPPGLLGAAMPGFLGFLLGKAMLETRGLDLALDHPLCGGCGGVCLVRHPVGVRVTDLGDHMHGRQHAESPSRSQERQAPLVWPGDRTVRSVGFGSGIGHPLNSHLG
jgi:hypothetical protein